MSGDDKAPAATREAFSLRRWSRLKQEAARAAERPAATPEAVAPAPAPPANEVSAKGRPEREHRSAQREGNTTSAPSTPAADPLPPVDSLSFDSDFTAFLRPQVDEGVKREALKKLFSDPRFNVMDGLDVYIDDYTKPDPLAPDVARALADACSILDPPVAPEREPRPEASVENAEKRVVATASESVAAPGPQSIAAPEQPDAGPPPPAMPAETQDPVAPPRDGNAPPDRR